MDHQKYKYHHIGLPTNIPQQNEEYDPELKFYAAGYFDSPYGIEWLRFEEDSPIHPLIKNVPHIAFVVENLEDAVKGKRIIYGPKSPASGVSVCFIDVEGTPVEFLQFDLPEEEIWPNPNKLVNPTHAIENRKHPLQLRYHHFGIRTNTKEKTVHYLENYKFYFSDYEASPYHLQWMNYEEDCALPALVKNISHVAFQVDDLEKAIRGKKVIIEPNSPSKGVCVAFIEENGAPIEFLQIED